MVLSKVQVMEITVAVAYKSSLDHGKRRDIRRTAKNNADSSLAYIRASPDMESINMASDASEKQYGMGGAWRHR